MKKKITSKGKKTYIKQAISKMKSDKINKVYSYILKINSRRGRKNAKK